VNSIFLCRPACCYSTFAALFHFITMIIATVIGLLASYAIADSRKALSRESSNRFFMLPFRLPVRSFSVLGFLLTFNHAPWTSGSFPIILPIAHALIAFAVRRAHNVARHKKAFRKTYVMPPPSWAQALGVFRRESRFFLF